MKNKSMYLPQILAIYKFYYTVPDGKMFCKLASSFLQNLVTHTYGVTF